MPMFFLFFVALHPKSTAMVMADVQEEIFWSSGDPSVQWSGTIYAILKEGIIGEIHVKLYEIWTSGSGGDVV